MSLAVNYTPDPLFSRRAYKRHMARTAKAFSAISMGAAFVLTSGEAFAQSSRASAENGFSPLDGQPIGFNEAGDLRVMLASGEEITIPRGEYGLVGDQIMVSDMIDGVEVAQNGYIPPTSDAYPVYGNTGGGMFGNMGMGSVVVPLGLILGGILVYFLITRANNDAPAFGEASYSANFAENGTGTVVAVSAVDAEGDSFSYSLSGTDAESFSIDASGNITFTDRPNFDSPGSVANSHVYSFNAVATDEHGEATSVPVSVTVTDASDTPTAATGTTYTGDATAEDITMAAGSTSVSMAGGSDTLSLDGGITSGTVDMGTGNDYVALNGAVAAAANVNLGTGNDELELNDAAGNVLTIDVGTGSDVIDIDVDQTAIHVVQNFGSDDDIDVSDLANLATFDATAHADLAAATAALATSDVAYYVSGANVIAVFDTSAGGTVDFSIQINGVSSLSADQFVL